MVQYRYISMKKHKILNINYKKRNPMAQEVRTPKYKTQVVKAKKERVVSKEKKVYDVWWL